MDDIAFAEIIIAFVAKAAGLQVAELKGPRRVPRFARPRHVAQFLIRENTTLSFDEIAKLFRGRHHATVLVAHRNEGQRAAQKAPLYLGGVSKPTGTWHRLLLEEANQARLAKAQKQVAVDLKKVEKVIHAKSEN